MLNLAQRLFLVKQSPAAQTIGMLWGELEMDRDIFRRQDIIAVGDEYVVILDSEMCDRDVIKYAARHLMRLGNKLAARAQAVAACQLRDALLGLD